MQETIDKLKELFENSVKDACNGKEKIGILWSAGIDSTLIAVAASKFCEVIAYSVGIAGAHDLEIAKNEAGKLPFKFIPIQVSDEEIEKIIPDVLSAIQTANPVLVGVCIPYFLVAKRANADGINTLLCGQGADELFGGYNRDLVCAAEEGYSALQKLMQKDYDEVEETNLVKNRAACETHGVKLLAPFTENNFSKFVMSIPAQEKVKEVLDPEYECVDEINGKKYIRKYILRKMAEKVGIPNQIINRPKKAAQYGSGVNKVLDRIARKKGWKQKVGTAYLRAFLENEYAGI